jgi:hypothetical protein
MSSAAVLTKSWVLAGDPTVEGLPGLPFFSAWQWRLDAEEPAASFQLLLSMPVSK